jgi:hypothetical protein
MSMSTRNHRFSYLGTLAVLAVSLVTLVLPLAPAKAQAWVQVGPFGFGVGPPAYAYPYRTYPYTYYGPGYYGGYYYGYPY